MSKSYTWKHPYKVSSSYKEKVAYFCMEYAIDQSLKIYSGGLGFLAGSHMRSAYELKQNMIGVGILWKYGYYDQTRHEDQSLHARFIEKYYSFLEDTNLRFQITINGNPNVWVKAYYLAPEVFGTIPMYLLSTDLPENDYLSQTICHRLYDNNEATRIAQSIVLGIGGAKLIEHLGGADVYHINEGHALPLAFYLLYEKYKDLATLKEHFVFTTHTPEKAGNEEHDLQLLNHMGFFYKNLNEEALNQIAYNAPKLSYTPTALRMSKRSNGVSELHGQVARDMWKSEKDTSPIIAITNAQNKKYWADKALYQHLKAQEDEAFIARKRALKQELFEVVADQTGKHLDPDALTIVWARRFAGYKRADLLLYDTLKFEKLISNPKMPLQIIWAGKPYPMDSFAIDQFNFLIHRTRYIPTCAVLTGYELKLSKILKGGADIWLNTPRRTREASGTSGMTASMNGAVNFSIFDGWICEFIKHQVNGFKIKPLDEKLSIEEQDRLDAQNMYDILFKEIIPTYYKQPKDWWAIVKQSMMDVAPQFDSDRMADDYYQKLYKYQM